MERNKIFEIDLTNSRLPLFYLSQIFSISSKFNSPLIFENLFLSLIVKCKISNIACESNNEYYFSSRKLKRTVKIMRSCTEVARRGNL